MSKYKNKKSRSAKNKANHTLTAKEVAGIAGCSVSYVKQIRAGHVNAESALAKKVLAVDQLADGSKGLLVEEVKRILNK